MAGCAADGGCPSDYIALSVSSIALFLLLVRSIFPFLFFKVPLPKGSAFWIPATQVFASFNLLLSAVMSVHLIRMKEGYWWQSCYIWSVIHLKKPLDYRCQMSVWWIIPIVCVHSLYVAMLMGFTKAIQHVEFRYHELKDLWRGVLVSTLSVGIWVVAYVLSKVHEDVEWIQVGSRFLLSTTTSLFVVSFFSISSSQPLLAQMSLKKKEHPEAKSMGKALGIPNSRVLLSGEEVLSMDPNEPLDKLLSDKSCLAGESVHFYIEVCELNILPTEGTVRRIYMARHIIQKYIIAGAEMEVNISHRTRQQILNTCNLADPDLFKNAMSELL